MAGLFGVVELRPVARTDQAALTRVMDHLAITLRGDPHAREQRWSDPAATWAVARIGRPYLDTQAWPLPWGRRRMFAIGHPLTDSESDSESDSAVGSAVVSVADAPEGFYAALTVDDDGAVTLQADRCGSRRLFYAVIDDRLCFAPEARALAALPGAPRRLDPGAVGMLLSSGVLYRDQTLLEGVRRLCGGERLVIAQGRMTAQERFRFVPGADAPARADRGALTEELARRVLAATARHMDRTEDAVLFLSGGVDSRLILAGIAAIPGVTPADIATVTWGDVKGAADSDMAVAARLAAALGLRHQSLLREEADFCTKFEAFNRMIGGASVIAAEHPDEPRIMAVLAAQGFRRAFRGDQPFLTRPAAYTIEQAWQGIGLRRLRETPQAAALLAPGPRAQAIAATEAVFDDIARRYGDFRPTQAKEMLYFDVRMQGYLFDAAYARQTFLDERNVLLDDPVLALSREIPDDMRRKSEVFSAAGALLTAHWPFVPIAKTRNLAPWVALSAPDRPAGRHCRAAPLDSDSAIWDTLDRDAVMRLLAGATDAPTPSGYHAGRRLVRALRMADNRIAAAAATLGRRMVVRAPELVKRVLVLKSAHDTLIGKNATGSHEDQGPAR